MAWIARGLHIDSTVCRELGSIHQDLGAVSMGHVSDTMDGRGISGDVRRSGHRDETNTTVVSLEVLFQVVEIDPAIVVHANVNDRSQVSPGQHIGVVLHDRRQDDVVLLERQAEGEPIDGIGGVNREDGDHFVGIGVNEFQYDLPRPVVEDGRQPRLEARSAVNTRVPIGHLINGLADRSQGRGTGGVIEVDVATASAVYHRNSLLSPATRSVHTVVSALMSSIEPIASICFSSRIRRPGVRGPLAINPGTLRFPT